MHSSNIHNLTKYGKALDTAIFVKNAPSYAGIGSGGEGFTTYTIASKTGEGLTNAQTFTKSRRCVMSNALYIR
jgi:propionaldehyde dehydrogenase